MKKAVVIAADEEEEVKIRGTFLSCRIEGVVIGVDLYEV